MDEGLHAGARGLQVERDLAAEEVSRRVGAGQPSAGDAAVAAYWFSARGPEALDKVAAECVLLDAQALAVPTDVTDADAMQAGIRLFRGVQTLAAAFASGKASQ